MIRRFLSVLLILLFVLSIPLAAEDGYEPYTEEEFPTWALDLRRFEVIMIGAIPVTMLVSILGYNIYQSVEAYASNPTTFTLANAFSAADWDVEQRKAVFTIGVSLSAAIALADYMIGRREDRSRDEQ